MHDARATRRLAYLISRYPAVSHAFILREVLSLRERGLAVEVASINAPDMSEAAMPAAERAEADHTYYVKRHGLRGALGAHLSLLATNPAAWLRGAAYAVGLGGSDARRILLGFAYFTEALMIGRWMRRRSLGHLHVHFATAAANIGLYVKKVFGTSLSLTVHGPDEFDNVSAQWLPEKIAASDFVFCIGSYARSQVMRLSPPREWRKFDVSPLGVDTGIYRPGGQARAHGPFRILCVGRLTPAKGQHVLIDAARRLRDAGLDFRITLVGSGPDEASLREAVVVDKLATQVQFTGALNQTQVRALYAQADAFVLPSFAEGIPVVLMEAMASGIPCVTTRITGIPELIQSEDEGLLVAPSDASALAAALRRLIEDPALRARIALAARARVEADYNLLRNTGHLAELFSKRLDQAPC
jgi:glycosyltransferase involved in cell wall biosynthesis